MGCDIHSIAQVRRFGYWETVATHVGGDDRNYHTFAILADVRNGYGFAGVPTSETWPVVSAPRGLPDDIEPEDRDSELSVPKYYFGDHSFSYLSLEELEAFRDKLPEWHIQLSVFTYDEAMDFFEKGIEPKSWCVGRSGPEVLVISEDDFKKGVKGTDVQVAWKRPVKKMAYLFFEIINELTTIQKKFEVGASDVRLVFGFDS